MWVPLGTILGIKTGSRRGSERFRDLGLRVQGLGMMIECLDTIGGGGHFVSAGGSMTLSLLVSRFC